MAYEARPGCSDTFAASVDTTKSSNSVRRRGNQCWRWLTRWGAGYGHRTRARLRCFSPISCCRVLSKQRSPLRQLLSISLALLLGYLLVQLVASVDTWLYPDDGGIHLPPAPLRGAHLMAQGDTRELLAPPPAGGRESGGRRHSGGRRGERRVEWRRVRTQEEEDRGLISAGAPSRNSGVVNHHRRRQTALLIPPSSLPRQLSNSHVVNTNNNDTDDDIEAFLAPARTTSKQKNHGAKQRRREGAFAPFSGANGTMEEGEQQSLRRAFGAADESVAAARFLGDRPVNGTPTMAHHGIEPSNAADARYARLPPCPEPSDRLTISVPETGPYAYVGMSVGGMPHPDWFKAGSMNQAFLLMTSLRESEVVAEHTDLRPGGEWRPDHCRSRHKVAIILPFRDRQSHLTRLLAFLIPMLKRQLLDFRFIVTEQYGNDLFNKGRIMNAAFTVADGRLGVDCVVFHDVDMFPQDDRTSYGCVPSPRHLGAYVNTLGYDLWYDYLVGGVLALSVEHYKQVNGYSNSYWAWGGEDDDMGKRILANKLTIARPPNKEFDRYTMLKHTKRKRTAPKLIYQFLGNTEKNWHKDGLKQESWKIVKLTARPLYYHLYVDVGEPPNEWRTDLASAKTAVKLTERKRRIHM